MTVKLLVGDVRDRIAEIPDGTVDLVVTSPPFLALRKYGDDGREMGSEGTPADFLDALLELTQEFRRVLAPHGSIAVELGDTYSGSGGAGGDYGDDGLREGQPTWESPSGRMRSARTAENPTGPVSSAARTAQESWKGVDAKNRGNTSRGTAARQRENTGAWPLAKSLVLAPGLYAASLAYGRNLLNPAHTFTPWRVRNIITWCRPNPPVGALGDKVRPATSYITVACTGAKRWFDLDAVRGPGSDNTHARLAKGVESRPTNGKKADNPNNNFGSMNEVETAGAPPLDWWDDALDPDDPTDHMTLVMPTQPYPGAHYATWPAKLAQRLIEMMCPLRVCATCGKPSERIVGDATYIVDGGPLMSHREGRNSGSATGSMLGKAHALRVAPTLGWSDCGHDTWRPGHVLDPFAGSGTTLAVAQGLGRDATGIELYEANAHLIRERVGLFLEEIA